MSIVIAFLVGLVVGFIGGMLFFRRHQSRIEADAKAVSGIAQNVADTTKKL